jgi:hypothetical protein
MKKNFLGEDILPDNFDAEFEENDPFDQISPNDPNWGIDFERDDSDEDFDDEDDEFGDCFEGDEDFD